MNIKKLEKHISEKYPSYRVSQIVDAVYQKYVSSFSEIKSLPKALILDLENNFRILTFDLDILKTSKKRNAHKASLILADGFKVETALLRSSKGGWTACISSQVGCQMMCEFCATGKAGLKRSLNFYEISDQVLFWQQQIKNLKLDGRLTNIVFMGMGEPFKNWDNVKSAVNLISDKKFMGFGHRHITISTVGLPHGILSLAKEFPQINLAVSLNFVTDKKRNKYMPVNRSHNLLKIKNSLVKYFKLTRRKIFLEYILFDNLNDSINDAELLVDFVNSVDRKLLHINLIRYNYTGASFSSSNTKKAKYFKEYLANNSISVTIRQSLGDDIDAACGQLATR